MLRASSSFASPPAELDERTDVTEVVAATAGHGESTLNLTDISYSQRKVDVDHENDLSIILYLPVLKRE